MVSRPRSRRKPIVHAIGCFALVAAAAQAGDPPQAPAPYPRQPVDYHAWLTEAYSPPAELDAGPFYARIEKWFPDYGDNDEVFEPFIAGPWTQESLNLESRFIKYEWAMREFMAATDLPRCFIPFVKFGDFSDFIIGVDYGAFRWPSKVVIAKAWREFAHGREDAIIEASRRCLQAADHLGRQPVIMAQYSSASLYDLGSETLCKALYHSADGQSFVAEHLSTVAALPAPVVSTWRGFAGELLAAYDACQRCFQWDEQQHQYAVDLEGARTFLRLTGWRQPEDYRAALASLEALDFMTMQASIDAYYALVEQVVKLPVDQAVLRSGHFDALLDNLVGDQPGARLMMFPSSTVTRLRLREASTHGRWHGMRIAWFLFDARYRFGALPQSLADLPATVYSSVRFAGEQGLRWAYAPNGSDFTLILAGLPAAAPQTTATPSGNAIVIWPPVDGPELISLLDRPLYAEPPGDRTKLDSNLVTAREAREDEPWNPSTLIWVARRLGYLWRMNDAVDVYSKGLGLFPGHAPLYRHRGHRYISLRQFDLAVDDLIRATELIRGRPAEIEPDGMPNARNIPLTTTGFNVWYHLGLAYYLQGDFERALHAYRETMKHTRGHDDNLVAVADWTYMTLRRLGRDDEAAVLLEPISADMDIIENHAYHRRLLMYKGELSPDDLLGDSASPLDLATQGYGVGNWYLYNGQTERAVEIFRRTVSGPYWPAFGYIASEVELMRLRPALPVSEPAHGQQETRK